MQVVVNVSEGAQVLEGYITSDHTIRVNARLPVSSGPVRVTLEMLSEEPATQPGESVWDVLDRIHAERAAMGIRPRTRAEIDAEIRELRDEDAGHDRLLDELYEMVSGQREATPC